MSVIRSFVSSRHVSITVLCHASNVKKAVFRMAYDNKTGRYRAIRNRRYRHLSIFLLTRIPSVCSFGLSSCTEDVLYHSNRVLSYSSRSALSISGDTAIASSILVQIIQKRTLSCNSVNIGSDIPYQRMLVIVSARLLYVLLAPEVVKLSMRSLSDTYLVDQRNYNPMYPY